MTGHGWSEELLGCGLGDLTIAGRTLASRRADAVAAVSGAGGDVVSLGANVLPSIEFARRLGTAARDLDRRLMATVEMGPEHREYGPNRFGAEFDAGDGGLGYDFVVGPADTVDRLQTVPHRVATLGAGPDRPQPGRMAEPIGSPTGNSFIWAISHWVDLLVANLLVLQAETGSIKEPTIAGTAEVHPTAVIERSQIGDGAVIGPYAVIRNSLIGDRCHIAEHTSVDHAFVGPDSMVQTGAIVTGSAVGDNTVVSFQTAIRGSVLLGSSTVSAPVVARSVVGRDSFLARGVSINASVLTDDPVSVRFGGRSVSSGIRLLGCAIGRGARVGTGLTLPAGYEVPAGTYPAVQPIPRLDRSSRRRTPLLLMGRRFRALGLDRSDQSEPTEEEPTNGARS